MAECSRNHFSVYNNDKLGFEIKLFLHLNSKNKRNFIKLLVIIQKLLPNPFSLHRRLEL